MEPRPGEAGKPDAARPTGRRPRGDAAATRLDRTLPWIMVGWTVVGLFSLPIDEAFHVRNGPPLTALLAIVAFLWLAIAGTASVQAYRHARASTGWPAFAWSAVPGVLVLALPLVLVLLGEANYTEAEDEVCSPGLLPDAAVDALFGWMGPAYLFAPAFTTLAGLAFLWPDSTRRPGLWMLASTLFGASLFWIAAVLINNHCD